MEARTGHTGDMEIDRAYGLMLSRMGREDAERTAQSLRRLKEGMEEGVCHFTFRKTSGEPRECWGTRNGEIIGRHAPAPRKGAAEGSRRQAYSGTFPYFDLQRRDWRCFRVESLTSVDEDYDV